jgi:hypothetical protein
MGLARYILHGLPEIASYFIVALAGGLVSVAFIKHEIGTDKFWEVLQDSLNLIILAIIILFLAALLGACASSGDSPTGTAEEIQEVQTQLLGDMPLPQGARLSGGDSIIIGRGNEWVGRAVVNAVQGATDVYAFFQSEYPKGGWTTVTAVKAKTSILVFTKGDRTATVEIVDGSFGGPKSVIIVTSSPKNANVVAPVRK